MPWATYTAQAQAAPAAYGPRLEGFDYPYALKTYRFDSQRQRLEMVYMDIAPQGQGNGRTVLLHGKNFCGATWQATISALSNAGYRIVVPDQIGFCKSSKPQHYQFSFAQLAANTYALLKSLGYPTRGRRRSFNGRHARCTLCLAIPAASNRASSQ